MPGSSGLFSAAHLTSASQLLQEYPSTQQEYSRVPDRSTQIPRRTFRRSAVRGTKVIDLTTRHCVSLSRHFIILSLYNKYIFTKRDSNLISCNVPDCQLLFHCSHCYNVINTVDLCSNKTYSHYLTGFF